MAESIKTDTWKHRAMLDAGAADDPTLLGLLRRETLATEGRLQALRRLREAVLAATASGVSR